MPQQQGAQLIAVRWFPSGKQARISPLSVPEVPYEPVNRPFGSPDTY